MKEETKTITGRCDQKTVLRITAIHPFSAELTSEQLNLIADIAEQYGSGRVHVTARQSVEVPDVPVEYVKRIEALLHRKGLRLGSTGRFLRNVMACSRWCLYNAWPMSELARELNEKYSGVQFPGKTTISLSGCDFSCVRSRTSDIGVIAKAEIALTDKECKHCKLCVKEPLGCQVDAIELGEDSVVIDSSRCVGCGFCWHVCRPGTIVATKTYFEVYIGGRGGIKPAEAVLFTTVQSEKELKDVIDSILKSYLQNAREGERIADVLQRYTVEVFNVGTY